MAGKYDPVAGRVKSALQKYVRRGEVEKAIAVTAALLERGDGVAVARRLPVIAAEDVGLRYVPVAAEALDRWQKHKDAEGLLSATALLARAPKLKEAYWL